MNHADLYQRITDRIVAQLEKGVAPWQQPWATIGGGLPMNVVMDGDHESGLASAGWGTDEDYGYFGDLDWEQVVRASG
jgi:antirestriction protein ArdC